MGRNAGTSPALRASELRYRRLFEAAQDGILILDAETAEIADINPYLCDLLGFSRQEVLGKKLWELGAFKDTTASKVNFRDLQRHDYIRYDDLPLETVDGRRVAVEFVSNVYMVEGERVIQCNIRDITARKKISEEHRRLLRAVTQSESAIIMTDPQGNIAYTNPAFERISGWSSEEVRGRNPRILKSGKQDDAFYRQMWKTLARGETWSGVIVNRRKDGKLYESATTISPVRDDAGEVVNYVADARDITAESHLRRQLFQAQKTEAVGRLAGGVAHDFNNLLTVILGYGELLAARLGGDHEALADVSQIQRAAERAAGLTRQLLAFGRRQVLKPTLFDVNGVVADMEKMLRRLIREDVALATRLEPGLGMVRADPGQIEQVLMNLAINARDALPAGGQITIETRNCDLDVDTPTHQLTPPGSYVMFSVTDTGMGMDAETQAHVFEPFFSTKEVGQGTGLGLSTVEGIVEQSGGHLRMSSEVGVGTTIAIYLPRIDQEAPLATALEAPRLPGGVGTVLLIEDEAAVRDLVRRLLESNGYSVIAARDGAEGLALAAAHAGPLHAMVTDLVLPGMTGATLARLVARERPGIKILFVSGYSDELVAGNHLLGPGRAFLGKPFTAEALLGGLRELLDSE